MKCFQEVWGGSGNDSGTRIIQTSDGGYAVTGQTYSFTDTSSGDMFLLKFDPSGNLTSCTTTCFQKTWGGTGTEIGNSVIQTSDGGYAVTGTTYSSGTNGEVALVKFDPSGNLTSCTTTCFQTTFGSSGTDEGHAIIQTSDGGYAVAGDSNGFGLSNYDALLVKYNSSGSISGCSTACATPSWASSTISGTVSNMNGTGTIAAVTSSNYIAAPSSSTPSATITVLVAFSPSGIGVGTPQALQNTAYTENDGTPFRMRMDIGISNAALSANAASLELQYAPMTTSCDTSFTNTSTYQNVTNTTPVQFYKNTNAANGMPLTTDANDPTDGSNTLIRETYQGYGTTTFTNPSAIPAGDDGMWDFALTTYHTLQNTSYCLRIINSSGSNLDTYAVVAQINMPTTATYSQDSWRLFQPGSSQAATFADAWGNASQATVAQALVQTADGGYAVTGHVTGGGAGNDDVFLAKYDPKGNLSSCTTTCFLKIWGGSFSDDAYSIIQTADGGYAVTGATSSFGTGIAMFLLKYDPNGNLTGGSCGIGGVTCFQRTWGGGNAEHGQSVVQTSDGGYAVTGYTFSFSGNSNPDVFLVKYDPNGNLTGGSCGIGGVTCFQRTWGASNDDRAYSVIQTSDGGYAVTGSYSTGVAFLLKFDPNGNLSSCTTTCFQESWSSGGSSAMGESVIQTSDSGYAITGYTNGGTAGSWDMFMAKFDSSGNLSWSRIWGGSNDDEGYSIKQASDGGYAVAGYTGSFGGTDAFLVKYDPNGNLSSCTTTCFQDIFGGSGIDEAFSVVQTSDGGYAIAGQTGNYGVGTLFNSFIAKYDSSGNINNCGSICGTPSATTNTSATTIAALSNVPGTPAGTVTTPSGTVGTPTGTATVIVALSYSAIVASPLESQNAPYNAPKNNTNFRLRMDVGVSGTGVPASAQSFKLQYALRGSDNQCDPAGNNETYADVTSSTPVAYYTGGINSNGDGIITSANDPTDGSNAVIPETYVNANTFTNAMSTIYAGQSGEWDFSLYFPTVSSGGALPAEDFCFKAVPASGSPTFNYSSVSEISHGPQTMSGFLRHDMWFSTQTNPYPGTNNKQGYLLHGN